VEFKRYGSIKPLNYLAADFLGAAFFAAAFFFWGRLFDQDIPDAQIRYQLGCSLRRTRHLTPLLY